MLVRIMAGIMAILLAAIVMSHYTHSNLSLVTQINMQQTLRALAFMAGRSLSLAARFVIDGNK